MKEFIISEEQILPIKQKLIQLSEFEMAKEKWNRLTKEEKEFVLHFTDNVQPKNSKILKEAWYNTVMDIVGLVDPTPITDTINAITYFAQGNTMFGILSLVAALPGYVGDIVAKPVMASLKIGGKTTKMLDNALSLAKTGDPRNIKRAETIISELAQNTDSVGKFLQKSGGPNGWASKMLKYLDILPDTIFKGLKNTIRDYFELLGKAGSKSLQLQQKTTKLASTFKKGKDTVKDIEALKDFMKTTKVFDVAALSKPGMLGQVISGGVPRILRTPEGRRLKILMQKTKFYLGFLDAVGIGNWVGPDEAAKLLGSEEEMNKALEEYSKTDEGKKYLEDEFGSSFTQSTQQDGQKDSDKKLTAGEFFGQMFGSDKKQMAKSDPLVGMLTSLF